MPLVARIRAGRGGSFWTRTDAEKNRCNFPENRGVIGAQGHEKSVPSYPRAGLLAALVPTAQAKIERVVEKTFTVQPGGNRRVDTEGGEIRVATSFESAGGAVKLGTSGGDVSAGTVAGEADLNTSGGNIHIDSVACARKSNTSGGNVRAGFVGPLQDTCSLSTSGGSVSITLDKTAAFRLDASTDGGSVDAEGLTITVEKTRRGRTQLSGAVNGRGPGAQTTFQWR